MGYKIGKMEERHSMKHARMTLDKAFQIGPIDPRIYGSFLEHMGRAIYEGIYEPGHPAADEQGFRTDVIRLVRGLGVPIVRYPGGNFVSGFQWEDSVGSHRPHRLDLAWFATEPNAVGLHEFCDWCEKAQTAPMYCVNLGTRGPEQARDVVEYANHPSGSKFSDMRIANGKKEPLNIKLWCLGNEMDGPWQMGSKTAQEYARIANESAKMMKWVDPSIELVACGSSGFEMPTFGSWEWTVLDECYDNIDYISLHRYYGNPTGKTSDFLARTMDMDAFIRSVIALCDAVKGKKHAKKSIHLSFDEWNIIYHTGDQEAYLRSMRWGQAVHRAEDVYNFEDALLTGSILITLLRNADRVKIACLAQLVNVIAPIMTRGGGGCWAQTTYYPFMHASRYGRGAALRTAVDSPVYDCVDYEGVPFIDATATLADDGSVTVFCVNRSTTEPFALDVDLHGFGALRIGEHILLHNDDAKAVNTESAPYTVVPTPGPGGCIDGEKATLHIPALSWNVIRFVR